MPKPKPTGAVVEQPAQATSWNTPPATPEQDSARRATRRRNVRSGVITVLVTIVLIAAGIAAPSIAAPFMDPYIGQTVQLGTADGTNVEQHVFEDPVTLYPWNMVSDTSRLEPLDATDRSVLTSHGVPDFLLNAYSALGYLTSSSARTDAYTSILDSFRLLDLSDTTQQDCYVLVNWANSSADLPQANYAVDLNGNVISLRFDQGAAPAATVVPVYPNAWSTLDPASSSEDFRLWSYADFVYREASLGSQQQLTSDFAQLDASLAQKYDYARLFDSMSKLGTSSAENTAASSGSGAQSGSAAGGESGAAAAAGSGASQAGTGTSASASEGSGSTGADASGGTAATGDANSAQSEQATAAAEGNPAPSSTGQTAQGGQQGSIATFSSPLFDVAAPDASNAQAAITPTVFSTGTNQLYIFDLSQSIRIIIYYDPSSQAFIGFNLQRNAS
jgi:hypothetical protein